MILLQQSCTDQFFAALVLGAICFAILAGMVFVIKKIRNR